MADMEVTKDVIHHRLKGARRICQAKEHDQWLKQAIFCLKCSFFLIASFNPDVIVSPMDIKFCEDVGILDLAYEIWYKWQWIAIADGVFIQLAIILYWVQFTVFLFDKEEGRCVR